MELAQPFLVPNWDVVDMCLGRHFLVRRKKGLGRTPSILLPTNLSFFRGCRGSSTRLFEDNQAFEGTRQCHKRHDSCPDADRQAACRRSFIASTCRACGRRSITGSLGFEASQLRPSPVPTLFSKGRIARPKGGAPYAKGEMPTQGINNPHGLPRLNCGCW